jgi:fido (protein-threonine AMPylation protein)
LPVPWNDDRSADLPRIRDNLRRLLTDLVEAAPRRRLPSISRLRQWHRRIYEGAQLPVSYYAGGIRDSDPDEPELFGYEVIVGRFRGVDCSHVPEELELFEGALREAAERLDSRLPPESTPADEGLLHSVVVLAAAAHGELVRIHPFANGNGRVARLLANRCLLRYGLPPVVRLKPRSEGNEYVRAAEASMEGDHQPMVQLVLAMLGDWLRHEDR